MPLLIVAAGIVLLLVLILLFKLNSFLAFVIVSLAVALAEGMGLHEAVTSIERGIGDTLGILVMILGLGAMLGKLVADSGAAQRITSRLVQAFGIARVQWALMLTAFIVGIPLFYDVGFVIMMPIVFAVAASTGARLLYVGLPTLASLSVTHGYLPPHPAPTAVATMFEADIGKTLVYGIIIAIPAVIVAGPILSRGLKNIDARPLEEFTGTALIPGASVPGVATSILSALLPVILIGVSTVADYVLPEGNGVRRILGYFGNPVIAMLVSLLLAIYTLGIARGRRMADIMTSLAHSISALTMVMLIIAGAGALKQVLVDSGVSVYIGELLQGSPLSPLFLGWLIATVLRVCVGSATIAGITTAGIVLPLVSASGVNRELMVLAIGSGSLMLAHVNDGGFWLVKEYFNLSIKDTIKTWTVMETAVGVTGLVGVMILNMFI
ncbi:MAG TPA: gluconate:H+ symporter [Vicinamibacterales bacterium]|nr:gluconate:H+ symporter [Vicinamibacterales bacterium]